MSNRYDDVFKVEDKLFTVTDPSYQLRRRGYAIPTSLAAIYRQHIIKDNPSNSRLLSGNFDDLLEPAVNIAHTGERLLFQSHDANIYNKILYPLMTTNTQHITERSDEDPSHREHDKVVSSPVENSPFLSTATPGSTEFARGVSGKYCGTSNKLYDPVGGNGAFLTGCSRREYFHGLRESDEEIRDVLDSLSAKLRELPVKDHPCSTCSRYGHVSMCQGEGLEEPCPHSKLKNVPVIYKMSIFDEAIRRKKFMHEVLEDKEKWDILSRKLPNDTTEMAEEDTSPDQDDLDVSHLLTYKPEETISSLNASGNSEFFDIKQLDNVKSVELNRLDPINTASLRQIASQINKETLLSKTLPNIKSHFNDLAIISMKYTHETSAKEEEKLNLWKCPPEHKLSAKDTIRDSTIKLPKMSSDDRLPGTLSGRIKERNDFTHWKGSSAARDAGATSDVQSRHVDFTDVGSYTSRHSVPSMQQTEDYYYDPEMSLDMLMSKYIELRKSESSQEYLKALKHLICDKMNKERIYIKSKTENKLGSKRTYVFDRIIDGVNTLYNANLKEDKRVDDGLPADDESVYTYSSLSISSYNSVVEDMTLEITRNSAYNEDPQILYQNVLDVYGWVNITNENSRNSHPRVLYAELIGDNLSIYSAANKNNITSIEFNDPIITIQLNDSFTVVKRKDTKRNRNTLRINANSFKVTEDSYVSHSTRVKNYYDNDETDNIFLRVEADTDNEVINWYTTFVTRSRLRSFVKLLNDYKVTPLMNTFYYFLYPKRKHFILNKIPYIRDLESFIVKSYINTDINYLDYSERSMTDDDFLHHVDCCSYGIDVLNLSDNSLTLSTIGLGAALSYMTNTRVRSLYLDRNPLNESFYGNLLLSIVSEAGVRFISFRGCNIYDPLIETVKTLNKKLSVSNSLTIDLRDTTMTADVQKFFNTYPLNKVKAVLQPNQLQVREPEMEFFIDNKNLQQISNLGTTFNGRLLSTHKKLKCRWFGLVKAVENTSAIDVYFEFRAPYLVWYDWSLAKKRRWFRKASGDDEDGSNIIESQVLFVRKCDLVVQDNMKWLYLRGYKPKINSKTAGYEIRIIVKGYTDTATERWYEIINRSISGIAYVDFLLQHPHVEPSKHILSFCMFNHTTELIMNEFPRDRRLLFRFLSMVLTQRGLRVLNFTNMLLTTAVLTFDKLQPSDLHLEKLDWSFNSIDFDGANISALGTLIPVSKCKAFNISNNPLGDFEPSAKLLLDCIFKLDAKKISFNYCKLGDKFLRTLISDIRDEDEPKNCSLEILELEGNSFSDEVMKEFLNVLISKFPSLLSVRLNGSVRNLTAFDELMENDLCTFDKIAATEPLYGRFKRVVHIKKQKRTTRETVEKYRSELENRDRQQI